jgi:hypothetical protein
MSLSIGQIIGAVALLRRIKTTVQHWQAERAAKKGDKGK